MNSGWTKLAAISSIGLDPDKELAIWDSRVSHTLIKRLDEYFKGEQVPTVLEKLGRVPGRGANRAKTVYCMKWPNGDGSWPAQFKASELIRAMRDVLNERQIPRESGTCDGNQWSVRDVEAVLFMDGY